MSYLADSLRKRLRILGLLAVPLGAAPALANYATPIGLTGWNADVVYAADFTNDYAQGFGGPLGGGGWGDPTWYQSSSNMAGGITADASYGFTSNVADPYNGGASTHFTFQPFIDKNVLYLAGSGGSISLKTRAAYQNLAVLAASAWATGTTTGELTLNFADGTNSSPISYNAFDWGGGNSSPQRAFMQNFYRSANSGGTEGEELVQDSRNGASFNMYETDIDLTGASGYSNKLIQGITFAEPSAGDIGIFAVSGVENSDPAPAPEPATLALFALGGLALLASRRRRKPR